MRQLTGEMAELKLKYTEADADRRDMERLKTQLHLQNDNTSARDSSALHDVAEVFLYYRLYFIVILTFVEVSHILRYTQLYLLHAEGVHVTLHFYFSVLCHTGD